MTREQLLEIVKAMPMGSKVMLSLKVMDQVVIAAPVAVTSFIDDGKAYTVIHSPHGMICPGGFSRSEHGQKDSATYR